MNDLIRLSARAVVDLLRRGEVSPLEAVDASLARIAAVDGALNALPTVCAERAREHARRLMKTRGAAQPPAHGLHGLPVAVKDNNEVTGVRCTMGSRVYAERVSTRNDLIVDRLEAAGAIVVAKSNLPEFAAGGTTSNEVFGTTTNPWDTRLTCGGSSGGSASALAAGEVWLATGNDFAGSIRIPSAFCGTVGLRPTPGTVARLQRQPYSPLSVEGPMARDVGDLALMLDCEAGEHPGDPLSRPAPALPYSAAAASPRLPARIAFSTDLGLFPAIDPEIAQAVRASARAVESPAVQVREACPDLSDAHAVFSVLRSHIYVGRLADTLDRARDRMTAPVIWNIEQGLARPVREVVEAEIAQAELARRVLAFFDEHDLLLCPATLVPPFPADLTQLERLGSFSFESYYHWMIPTYAITVTACPALVLPCGLTSAGLPIGLQLVGPPRSEHRLLAAAAWMEQAFGLAGRVPRDPAVSSAS